MKITRLRIAVLAAVVYLISLVALFPAALAARWFLPEIPGLAIGPLNGTIWNGSAASVEYRGANVGKLEWQLHALAFFGLAADADLVLTRANLPPLTTNVRAAMNGTITFENLRGTLQLADLERAGALPRNIASGELLIDLSQLELIDRRPVAASGRIGLTGLQSTFLPGVNLGSYEARVKTEQEVITGEFSQVEAPLRVNGEARVQPDGRYRVSGNITPTAQTPENLRRGLALLGSPDASGQHRFSFEGSL